MYKKTWKKSQHNDFPRGTTLWWWKSNLLPYYITKDKVTNYHVVQMGVIRKVLHSQRQWDMISNSGKIKINVQKKQLCME